MSILEAIILGIIQGLTEFLPVSSSGHIALGSYLVGLVPEENLLFSVILHAATALSTMIVFQKDILSIIKNCFSLTWNIDKSYAVKILISMIPVGLIGVLFEDYISSFFGENILFVGLMLIVTGSLLLFTYYTKERTGNVTYGKAFIIGMAQAVAILPGISRSGSTIATALFLGVEKSKAAKFSFLMVLIPILGATLLKVKDYMEAPVDPGTSLSTITLIAGFIAAFISGLFACKWMIALVKKGKLIYFAYYCFLLGIVAITASTILG